MAKRSISFSRPWRFFWRLLFLAALFAAVPYGGVIANEQNVWQSEIENMRKQLLHSLDCFNRISKLAKEQNLKHEEALQLLDEQRRLLDSSQKRINDLLSQIASSQESSAALLKELARLQSLQNQAQKQYEKLSKAYSAYRQEAEKQIKDIQGERDRARRWLKWAIPGIGMGFLIGAIFGVLIY